MADEIEATRCDVCGAFSTGDECCGKGKPFATPFIPSGFPPVEPEKFFYAAWGGIPRADKDVISGRPGSTVRFRGGNPGGGKRAR